MPRKARTPCKKTGCPRLTKSGVGYCDEHAPPKKPDPRPSAARRGYGRRWRKIRKMHLRRHPLCYDCTAEGRTTEATEVHHVRPLSEGGTHAFGNLMSLCKSHHSRRTALERGDTHAGEGR